uniref:Uncharacterized protein n=1 Tax=Corethron hystrix TaxID=216773 RepID=A0A7S1G199_9STRA|mmetsp:Transcript_7720/g.16752  ORF Transcript_7720/g.16752 Transcript_7720/m.16752 type:complete len:409 (+) Transcript_7720:3-1229(+)
MSHSSNIPPPPLLHDDFNKNPLQKNKLSSLSLPHASLVYETNRSIDHHSDHPWYNPSSSRRTRSVGDGEDEDDAQFMTLHLRYFASMYDGLDAEARSLWENMLDRRAAMAMRTRESGHEDGCVTDSCEDKYDWKDAADNFYENYPHLAEYPSDHDEGGEDYERDVVTGVDGDVSTAIDTPVPQPLPSQSGYAMQWKKRDIDPSHVRRSQSNKNKIHSHSHNLYNSNNQNSYIAPLVSQPTRPQQQPLQRNSKNSYGQQSKVNPFVSAAEIEEDGDCNESFSYGDERGGYQQDHNGIAGANGNGNGNSNLCSRKRHLPRAPPAPPSPPHQQERNISAGLKKKFQPPTRNNANRISGGGQHNVCPAYPSRPDTSTTRKNGATNNNDNDYDDDLPESLQKYDRELIEKNKI